MPILVAHKCSTTNPHLLSVVFTNALNFFHGFSDLFLGIFTLQGGENPKLILVNESVQKYQITLCASTSSDMR